jgi:prolyl oligopeptidase
MRHLLIKSFTFTLFPAFAMMMTNCSHPVPAPPETPRGDVVEEIHGVSIADPYRWLEDQESPQTRAWIDSQNRYTDSFLDQLKTREPIEKRYTELLKVDYTGIPAEAGSRYFFTRRDTGQDLRVICMRDGLDGEDQVLIDPHPWSKDHTISASFEGTSPNGELLVYGIRKGGEDEVAIHLFDVAARQDMPDSLPRARYFGISVMPDLTGFYYTRFGAEGSRVYFHKMGTPLSADRLIFGVGYDPVHIIFAGISEDGKYLLVHVMYGSSADKTDVFIKQIGSSKGFTTVVKDVDGGFFADVYQDRLFVLTNWLAPNYRILSVPVAGLPSHPESWTEVIPEGESVIEQGSVVSKARFYDLDGRLLSEMELPALGTMEQLSYRHDSRNLFYSFSSFHIPTTIYRYDLDSGEKQVWAALKVPIDQDQIVVKQVWYASADSTMIPMFLVHRKDLVLNGRNPVYLTGYGGFNVSETAGFTATAVIWAENGGVFALPNLRGGGEFGEEWHKAGMLERKQNVFDDFYAAAEWLIDNKYARPEKIAVRGGSNGGLLVGALLTQRPDLVKAVVCAYPLLDMIRYQQFMVAKFWVPEYGSSDDPEQFKYLIRYSPYQNVRKGGRYPATLFITGDGDTRVAPLHARKMVAMMQYTNAANTPMLLRYDTKAGHTGGGSVTKTIEDATAALSFVCWQLGMDVK